MDSFDRKVQVSIVTVDGEQSSVTLHMLDADYIYDRFSNINVWVQSQYDSIMAGTFQFSRLTRNRVKKRVLMSQRSIGDAIRHRASEMRMLDPTFEI